MFINVCNASWLHELRIYFRASPARWWISQRVKFISLNDIQKKNSFLSRCSSSTHTQNDCIPKFEYFSHSMIIIFNSPELSYFIFVHCILKCVSHFSSTEFSVFRIKFLFSSVWSIWVCKHHDSKCTLYATQSRQVVRQPNNKNYNLTHIKTPLIKKYEWNC